MRPVDKMGLRSAECGEASRNPSGCGTGRVVTCDAIGTNPNTRVPLATPGAREAVTVA
jgi:hypothetical protein